MSHFFIYLCNRTLLFNSFSCLVVCKIINEEKGEMDRFIQLNIEIQRSSKSTGIYSNPEVLKVILSEDWVYNISYKSVKNGILKTLSVKSKIKGYIVKSELKFRNIIGDKPG